MIISDRIKAARKSKGLSQKELGELLGISAASVSQYENGDRNPKLETLQRFAKALGVSVDKLLYGYECDREYELICETLENARLKIEPTGFLDMYYVTHIDDPEDTDEREEFGYSDLVKIVLTVLKDAEANKLNYIRKRLDAELFYWL